MNWQQEKDTNLTLNLGGGIYKLQTFCEKKTSFKLSRKTYKRGKVFQNKTHKWEKFQAKFRIFCIKSFKYQIYISLNLGKFNLWMGLEISNFTYKRGTPKYTVQAVRNITLISQKRTKTKSCEFVRTFSKISEFAN